MLVTPLVMSLAKCVLICVMCFGNGLVMFVGNDVGNDLVDHVCNKCGGMVLE